MVLPIRLSFHCRPWRCVAREGLSTKEIRGRASVGKAAWLLSHIVRDGCRLESWLVSEQLRLFLIKERCNV